MCVPPPDSSASDDNEKEQAYWDSVRTKLCQRKMSSAAEYYKNRDWESTVRIYGDIVKYRCDQDDPEEVYQYYAQKFANIRNNQFSIPLYPHKKVNFDNKLKESDLFQTIFLKLMQP